MTGEPLSDGQAVAFSTVTLAIGAVMALLPGDAAAHVLLLGCVPLLVQVSGVRRAAAAAGRRELPRGRALLRLRLLLLVLHGCGATAVLLR